MEVGGLVPGRLVRLLVPVVRFPCPSPNAVMLAARYKRCNSESKKQKSTTTVWGHTNRHPRGIHTYIRASKWARSSTGIKGNVMSDRRNKMVLSCQFKAFCFCRPSFTERRVRNTSPSPAWQKKKRQKQERVYDFTTMLPCRKRFPKQDLSKSEGGRASGEPESVFTSVQSLSFFSSESCHLHTC